MRYYYIIIYRKNERGRFLPRLAYGPFEYKSDALEAKDKYLPKPQYFEKYVVRAKLPKTCYLLSRHLLKVKVIVGKGQINERVSCYRHRRIR